MHKRSHNTCSNVNINRTEPEDEAHIQAEGQENNRQYAEGKVLPRQVKQQYEG